MKLSRRSFYYKPKSQSPERMKAEADLRDKIETICLEYTRCGYRRVTHELRHRGCHVNHKKVLKIMRESDLLCRVNQVWLSDIIYSHIRTGFVYLVAILDAYSRKVISYAVSTRLDMALTLEALKMAIAGRRLDSGVIHHSYQGV